jgi:hypothetical protein
MKLVIMRFYTNKLALYFPYYGIINLYYHIAGRIALSRPSALCRDCRRAMTGRSAPTWAVCETFGRRVRIEEDWKRIKVFIM